MRRAERLFQIVQIMRRRGGVVTADSLAAELEVSQRCVYRDIAALVGQQVPIRGEAGLGYVLEPGFDLPPLMLSVDEVEAAMLGAQWVSGHGDPSLAIAARDLIAKIAAVMPAGMRQQLSSPAARTPPGWQIPSDAVDAATLRRAIRNGRKLDLTYQDAKDTTSVRVVWPVLIAYREDTRALIAWCELRAAFRNFRLDRISSAAILDEPCPIRPAVLQAKWLAAIQTPVPCSEEAI
ncbi:helix-turn-helix transcriptional regulator [Sphingomonas sp. UYP23]